MVECVAVILVILQLWIRPIGGGASGFQGSRDRRRVRTQRDEEGGGKKRPHCYPGPWWYNLEIFGRGQLIKRQRGGTHLHLVTITGTDATDFQ